jgi:hypothetical protein
VKINNTPMRISPLTIKAVQFAQLVLLQRNINNNSRSTDPLTKQRRDETHKKIETANSTKKPQQQSAIDRSFDETKT